MGSSKERVTAFFDAIGAAHRALAAMPVHAMTRREAEEVLRELDELQKLADGVERRLVGRLISDGSPTRFGASTWAEVLARRLRISHGEAQRRIAAAVHAA